MTNGAECAEAIQGKNACRCTCCHIVAFEGDSWVCAEAELAAVLAPGADSSPGVMPAWQAHGSSMAPFQGNGNGHAATHPGAADAMQKLLLAGKKAEALRCSPTYAPTSHTGPLESMNL